MKRHQIKQIGTGYFILIPKVLVDNFKLDKREFEIVVTDDGDIRYINVGKRK